MPEFVHVLNIGASPSSRAGCRRRGCSSRGTRRRRSGSRRSTAGRVVGGHPRARRPPLVLPARAFIQATSSTSTRCRRAQGAGGGGQRIRAAAAGGHPRRRRVRDSRARARDVEHEELLVERITRSAASTSGFVRGVSHTEYIRTDGMIYFLETSARVGGAHIVGPRSRRPPASTCGRSGRGSKSPRQAEYEPPRGASITAGLIVSLARQEYPELSVLHTTRRLSGEWTSRIMPVSSCDLRIHVASANSWTATSCGSGPTSTRPCRRRTDRHTERAATNWPRLPSRVRVLSSKLLNTGVRCRCVHEFTACF